MGQRNMMCIVKKEGKEFNLLLYNYIGITSNRSLGLLQFFSPFFYILNVLGACIITLVKFIVSLFTSLYRTRPEIIEHDELFLNFTYMFLERTKAANLYKGSKYWVIGPNIERKFVPKDKKIVEYKLFVSFADNFKILALSFNTIWNYLCYERSLCLIHKVWQFYELQIALSKIARNSTVYFANQSDKYATLIDNIPTKKKVLLQHGIALNWAKLPCPLKHVDTFYAISNQTWQDAYANILEGEPELKYFNPTIELTVYKNEKKSVLIVSEVTYFDQEREMLKALKDIDIVVYLKRHPGFSQDECYRNLQKEYGFNYVTEKVFPKVDFVISYFSTLAYEYMVHDIPVYIYNTKEEYNSEVMLKAFQKAVNK